MRIVIQSNSEESDFFKGLALLTNAAEITLETIVIDETQNEIRIPMRRKSYERRRLLFFGERYKLISPELIDSVLVIKNVISHNLKDNLHLADIHILFGISIRNKEIFCCSAEEQSGVTAFEISIKVQAYDLELQDT